MPKTAIVPLNVFTSRLRNIFSLSGLLFSIGLWPVIPATAQTPTRGCLVNQYDSLLQFRNPNYAQGRSLLNRLLAEPRSSARTDRTDEETLIIPVVVHVVHNNSSGQTGGVTNPNISDAQIRSQIEVLNEDYQRKLNTPGFNTSPVGANVNIEFRLAIYDPQGNLTAGITRHYSSRASFSTTEMNRLADIIYWPSNRYLNIWVTRITGDFIGYAQFPDMTGQPGLAEVNGIERTDGVIIDYRNFGRNIGTTTQGVYTEGRTTTHEIGHWLGLLHTWGDVVCDSPTCICGTDFINDTPAAQFPNETLGCPELFSVCGGVQTRNMIENYMDYSPDRCMNIFTQGQKDRIRRVLELSPRRKALIESARQALPETDKLRVRAFPNPVRPQDNRRVNLEILLKGNKPLQVAVFSSTGQLVEELSLKSTSSVILPVTLPLQKAGLYLIRVSTPDESQVTKVILPE